jgi:hypothetical protein
VRLGGAIEVDMLGEHVEGITQRGVAAEKVTIPVGACRLLLCMVRSWIVSGRDGGQTPRSAATSRAHSRRDSNTRRERLLRRAHPGRNAAEKERLAGAAVDDGSNR